MYQGRVVNITKFGAFVNILPGRDGLLHISKMGGGKRIDRVEDVLELGDEIEVRVDDVDPNGKVSLSPRHPARRRRGRRRRPAAATAVAPAAAAPAPTPRLRADVVSFEDAFDAELREEFGDLGPAGAPPVATAAATVAARWRRPWSRGGGRGGRGGR